MNYKNVIKMWFISLLILIMSNQLLYMKDIIDPVNSKYYIQADNMTTFEVVVMDDNINVQQELKDQIKTYNNSLVLFLNSERQSINYVGNPEIIGLEKGENLSQSQSGFKNSYSNPNFFDANYEKILGIQYVLPYTQPAYFNKLIVMSNDLSEYDEISKLMTSVTNQSNLVLHEIDNYLPEHQPFNNKLVNSKILMWSTIVGLMIIVILTNIRKEAEKLTICDLLGQNKFRMIQKSASTLLCELLISGVLALSCYYLFVVINNNVLLSFDLFQGFYQTAVVEFSLILIVSIIIQVVILNIFLLSSLSWRLK